MVKVFARGASNLLDQRLWNQLHDQFLRPVLRPHDGLLGLVDVRGHGADDTVYGLLLISIRLWVLPRQFAFPDFNATLGT